VFDELLTITEGTSNTLSESEECENKLKPCTVNRVCSHPESSVEQSEEWKFIDPLNSSVAFAIKNSGEEAVGAQGEVLSFFLEKFIYCRSHSAFHKINNVQSFPTHRRDPKFKLLNKR
jgi:hypothetical protein